MDHIFSLIQKKGIKNALKFIKEKKKKKNIFQAFRGNFLGTWQFTKRIDDD